MAEIDHETGEIIEVPAALSRQTSQLLGSPMADQLWTALVAAQQKMKSPKRTKTANITSRDPGKRSYSYKYAPIEEVARVIRKPCTDSGLWYQQGLVYRNGGQPFVRTIVYHSSGQWMGTDYPVFSGGGQWQDFDAGVTRSSRRGLMMAFGLTPEDDQEEVTNANTTRMPDRAPAGTADRRLVQMAWAAARSGSQALADFWSDPLTTREQRRALGEHLLAQLKTAAIAADGEMLEREAGEAGVGDGDIQMGTGAVRHPVAREVAES